MPGHNAIIDGVKYECSFQPRGSHEIDIEEIIVCEIVVYYWSRSMQRNKELPQSIITNELFERIEADIFANSDPLDWYDHG